MEQREKFPQKEHLRAEKRKQKEELRREKEAVKRKAAIEKATARRIARESMELIEDEQLEMMEIAASEKEFLVVFPPKSVQLKRPFAIQPWNNSEENIGNLLMVCPHISPGYNLFSEKASGITLKEDDIAVSNVKIDLTRGRNNPLESFSRITRAARNSQFKTIASVICCIRFVKT